MFRSLLFILALKTRQLVQILVGKIAQYIVDVRLAEFDKFPFLPARVLEIMAGFWRTHGVQKSIFPPKNFWSATQKIYPLSGNSNAN